MTVTTELKRMITNSYDTDKEVLRNILNEFSKLESQNRTLLAENKLLKEKLDQSSL